MHIGSRWNGEWVFFLEKLQIGKMFEQHPHGEPWPVLTLAEWCELALHPITVIAQHKRRHLAHPCHTCPVKLCCPFADPSEPFGISPLGKYQVLCQVMLWEATQESSCSSCTFKKPIGITSASKPRGCPHCHAITCALPAFLKSSGSTCQARAAGTGLSLLAGDAPWSPLKNAWINLPPLVGFPHGLQTLEGHPEKSGVL